MSVAKITISIEEALLRKLDQWIHGNSLRSRSQAIQIAIQNQVDRFDQTRLSRECRLLDQSFEQECAEEGMLEEGESWPEY